MFRLFNFPFNVYSIYLDLFTNTKWRIRRMVNVFLQLSFSRIFEVNLYINKGYTGDVFLVFGLEYLNIFLISSNNSGNCSL